MNKFVVVESPTRSNEQGILMYSHCSLARVLAIKACKPLGVFTKIIRLKDFDSMVYGSKVLLASVGKGN
jgi:hypothetical protein